MTALGAISTRLCQEDCITWGVEQLLAKYKDKWVALQGKRVVASGKSVREVQEKVARKKITDFAFHYVPSKRLAMVV